MQFESLDQKIPFEAQLQEKTGTVVLVNTVIVPDGLMDEVLESWAVDAAFMKAAPGCISTQLHRGTAGSDILINVAVWESTETLFKAFSDPEFQAKAAGYPEGVIVRPYLCEKVAVEGICVA
ncbi:antibiotic biosynthesis monooxygenase family protein [Streptomyces sp. CA-111067]|jgi:quinol monooxygenase YgiN|uniref:antibiotic biosynthesis monooxygenase family protein n=1 Tax=Streptomyces sp. CA-111067 TaxID=3240046 RepID=UPI003D97E544